MSETPVLGATAAPGATAPAVGDEIAVLQTNHGRIVFKFFPDVAPKHVEAFKKLARSEYYDGTRFHRVIPGFMIQGGDPNSKSDDRSMHGTGGPGYKLPAEFNDIPHTPGIVSAARTSDPNSAGSQFFLMHGRSPHLDRQYSVYGQVIEGMDVVEKIVNLPRDQRDNPLAGNDAKIEKVTIETWPLA
jgi:peptidyl-prolyl cis-trans isomerase B (cyclophilin B)